MNNTKRLEQLHALLREAEKKGDDVKWNLIAQEITALELEEGNRCNE
jgi:hypothetical protein